MKTVTLFTAVAATALIGGAVFAQQPTTPSTDTAPPTTSAPAQAAPTGTATATSVTTADPSSGATVTVTTLTNGPVPDTPANRAKYGQPMSNAGKRTPAKGN